MPRLEAEFGGGAGGVAGHAAVALEVIGEGVEAEAALHGADGGFGGVGALGFDFDEMAEAGEFVKFDEAIVELPGFAVFLKEEDLLEAKGLEERDKLIDGIDVEVEGFAGAQAGLSGRAFESEQGGGGTGLGVGDADAETGVFLAKLAGGSIEEDVVLADAAEASGAFTLQGGADGVVGRDAEFDFDLEGHGGFRVTWRNGKERGRRCGRG